MQTNETSKKQFTPQQAVDELQSMNRDIINVPIHDPVARGFMTGISARLERLSDSITAAVNSVPNDSTDAADVAVTESE